MLLPPSLAGVVLLGGVVLLAALPESRAEDRVALAVMQPGGQCMAHAVAPATLARIEAELHEEAQRLAAKAGRMMADAAAARLAEARERVPAFGEWAYGWVQSYVTSYRVLGRLLHGLAVSAQAGPDDALAQRLLEEVSQPMREAFGQRVLPPGLVEGLATDMRHTAAVLDQAWQAALGRAAAELAAAPPASATAAVRLDLATAGHSLLPGLAMAPQGVTAFGVGAPADASAAVLRAVRPMAARAGAAVLRASEAGSIVAAAGALGYALGGISGVVVGAVTGMGVSWTLDWGLSRVDSALHRSGFEAEALAALDQAERDLAEDARALAATALEARRLALRPAARGCGPVGAPA